MLNLPQKAELVERVEVDRNDRRLYEFFQRFSYLTAESVMEGLGCSHDFLWELLGEVAKLCQPVAMPQMWNSSAQVTFSQR